MLLAVEGLKILNGILNIDIPAGTALHIGLPSLDQFLDLALSQMHRIFPVPWRAAISKGIALSFNAVAEILVPADPSQFNQCLSLEWRCRPVRGVILREL